VGAELQSLKHAAVGGVDLANGPAWLSDWAGFLTEWKHEDTKEFPDHECPKCVKKGYRHYGTNYNYQPTPEEMEDPVYWVVFPSEETEYWPFPGYQMQQPRTIPRTQIMKRSKYEECKTADSFVFFKSYFHPCIFSFDWESLASLRHWQRKKPGRIELIIARLAKSGFKARTYDDRESDYFRPDVVRAFLEDDEARFKLRKSYGHGLYQFPGLETMREADLKPVKAAILAADELCEAGLNDQEHARKHYGLADIKFNWLAPEEVTIKPPKK